MTGRTAAILGALLFSSTAFAADSFHVSLSGNDNNPGTSDQPWRTLAGARDHLRQLTGEMTSDITVFLRGGYYPVSSPVEFDDRDSGKNGFRVIYSASPGERPVITGGRRVTGWAAGENGVWSAPFEHSEKIRDLWVNGVRRRMAQNSFADEDKIPGQGGWGAYNGSPTGIRFRMADIGSLSNHRDIEISTNSRWTYHILGVEEIRTDSAFPGEWVFRMQEPYFNIAQNPGWPEHAPHPTRGYWITNARELLDEPGEFYFDRVARRMYYMPFPGETLSTAEVIAPVAEGLLRISGRSMAQKVRNLVFSGLTFHHDAWQLDLIGNSRGASSSQGPKLLRFKGSYAEAEGDALLRAAVEITAAEDIQFHRNLFERLGGAAINLINGVNRCTIEGNRFRDIGASAVAVAHPDLKNIAVLTQFAEEEPCADNVIRNNHIRNVSANFWSAPAIIGFHPTRLEVSQNDIADSPYTAVSMGWMWNYYSVTPCGENRIWNNRIFNSCLRLWDGGAVYLLGRQPGTEVAGNHIGGSVDFGAVYADAGTSLLGGVIENVCEIPVGSSFFYTHLDSTRNFEVRSTFSTSPNFYNVATNVTISDTVLYDPQTPPASALQIIAAAGLMSNYADLADPATLAPLPQWPVATAFQQWGTQKYGAVVAGDESLRDGIWGWNADPDGNGLPNGVEYAMGGDGALSLPSLSSGMRLEGGNLVVRFTTDPARTDVRIVAEHSSDLSNWSAGGIVLQQVGEQGGLAVWEASVAPSAGPVFLRLNAFGD